MLLDGISGNYHRFFCGRSWLALVAEVDRLSIAFELREASWSAVALHRSIGTNDYCFQEP